MVGKSRAEEHVFNFRYQRFERKQKDEGECVSEVGWNLTHVITEHNFHCFWDPCWVSYHFASFHFLSSDFRTKFHYGCGAEYLSVYNKERLSFVKKGWIGHSTMKKAEKTESHSVLSLCIEIWNTVQLIDCGLSFAIFQRQSEYERISKCAFKNRIRCTFSYQKRKMSILIIFCQIFINPTSGLALPSVSNEKLKIWHYDGIESFIYLMNTMYKMNTIYTKLVSLYLSL